MRKYVSSATKKFLASAVVLLAWYLMLPPPMFPPIKTADGDFKVNTEAPLSKWLMLKKFNSEAACKQNLRSMAEFYRCVRSDDPKLKPAALPTPSAPVPGAAAAAPAKK